MLEAETYAGTHKRQRLETRVSFAVDDTDRQGAGHHTRLGAEFNDGDRMKADVVKRLLCDMIPYHTLAPETGLLALAGDRRPWGGCGRGQREGKLRDRDGDW